MKRNLSFIASISIVVIYLAFGLLSYSKFPLPYSPLQNWLSDLGSSQLNPHGAFLYNLGIVLTGAALLPFFFGLGEWTLKGRKIQNVMLFVTRAFGYLGAIAMLMSAVFPITAKAVHSFLSAALYILLGTAFAFSVAALRYHPRYPRGLLVLGVLVVVEDFIWSVGLNTTLMEWVTVSLFLGYVLILGIETNRKVRMAIDVL